MKAVAYLVFILLGSSACSKSEPEAKPVDYRKLCDHLVPLFPETGRESFTQTCEANYRRDLPACRNAAIVADCFMNIKSWEERQPCAALCVHNSGPGR